MRTALPYIAILMVLAAGAYVLVPAQSKSPGKGEVQRRSIQAVLSSSEIDLIEAHFLIAAEIPEYKGMDQKREAERVRQMAQVVNRYIAGNHRDWQQNPERYKNQYGEYCLSNLLGVVLHKFQIGYKPGKLDGANPDLFFVNGLLNTKQGTCMSMHMLLVMLAQEVDLPIHGVIGGDHLFCRWDDGKYRANIEATDGGTKESDENYASKLGLAQSQLKDTVYLRNLTRRQMVGQFLYARAIYWHSRKNYIEAAKDAHQALELTGNDPQMIAFARSMEEQMVAQYSMPPHLMKKNEKSTPENDPLYYVKNRDNPVPRPAVPVPTAGPEGLNHQ